MSNLPPGWSHATIGDLLLRIEAGKSFRCEPRPASPSEWGIIKVSAMTWGAFREGENKAVPAGVDFNPACEIKTGDILVSRANTEEYVGAPVLVDRCRSHLLLSDKSLRLVPSDHLNSRWLYYLLSSSAVRREISRRATGTKDSMRNISQEALTSIEVQIPPLAEQDRIVAALEDHLSRVDAGSVYLNQAGQYESQLRIAIYTAAVEGRLIASTHAAATTADRFDAERQSRWRKEHGSRKYNPPVEPDLEIEPFVPNSWHVVSLEAATDPVRLIQYGILMPRVETKGSVPYVEVRDLAGETLSGKNLHRTSRELDEQFSKSRLAKNDVVMAVRGSYERSAVVPDDLEGANVSRDVVRIAPLTALDPYYLHIYLQSAFSRRYFSRHARGVAVKGVNTASVRSLPVVVPALEVQHEIVREIRQCIPAANKISTEISYARKRASNLRKSLLAEAFAGRLVSQDPTDEPAAVLLERIRAEQASQPRTRRGRRTAKQTQQGETLL
jgi:type I restriction enzyme, S subunit